MQEAFEPSLMVTRGEGSSVHEPVGGVTGVGVGVGAGLGAVVGGVVVGGGEVGGVVVGGGAVGGVVVGGGGGGLEPSGRVGRAPGPETV
jgi:hypothetical protein